jgi:1-acyl-sn-glycerol-3-phosphate acyltransferase
VGDPFILPPLDRRLKDAQQREEVLKEYTDEMMCRIAAQLPEDYWGFYAEHPRLQELLRGEGSG